MDADKEERYADFPVFKGLQKPLEFMGFQGRYIYWAAGTAGGAIVGFIIAYCLLGFVVGLVVLVFAISTGAALISSNNRRDCIPRRATKECISTPIARASDKEIKRRTIMRVVGLIAY